jgi:hypothetical protein
MLKFVFCLAALLAIPVFTLAQDAPAPPKGFSGTFVSLSGNTVTLQDKDGKTFTVEMTPGWTLSANRAGKPSDIRPGDFIATQNVPVSARAGRSTEVRILEPGYRPEEGTHAVSATNQNMMTHGAVKSVTATDAGFELEVTYPDGSRLILVPDNVPVTVSDPLDKSVLKPGQSVGGVTRTGSDGVPRASRLQLQSK